MAQLGAFTMLLVASLWLGGCSSRSYFVYRDSWDGGRHRYYERDHWHHDWGYGHYGHYNYYYWRDHHPYRH